MTQSVQVEKLFLHRSIQFESIHSLIHFLIYQCVSRQLLNVGHEDQFHVRFPQKFMFHLNFNNSIYRFSFLTKVTRVSCKDLEFCEFFFKYACQCKPVIITDLVQNMTRLPWDLQHIQNVAGIFIKLLPHVDFCSFYLLSVFI